MVKLEKPVIELIRDSVAAAKLIGAEALVVEDGVARALRDDAKALYIKNHDVKLPFNAIGITRLDVFSARYSLIDGRENVTMEAQLNERDQQVVVLALKAKGIKADFRCANPSRIEGRREFTAKVEDMKITVNEDAIVTLGRALNAMNAENITLVVNNNEVTFELVDESTKDVFTYAISNDVEFKTEIPGTEHTRHADRYTAKVLYPLFKALGSGSFWFAKNGLIKITVNGFPTYVLPDRE